MASISSRVPGKCAKVAPSAPPPVRGGGGRQRLSAARRLVRPGIVIDVAQEQQFLPQLLAAFLFNKLRDDLRHGHRGKRVLFHQVFARFLARKRAQRQAAQRRVGRDDDDLGAGQPGLDGLPDLLPQAQPRGGALRRHAEGQPPGVNVFAQGLGRSEGNKLHRTVMAYDERQQPALRGWLPAGLLVGRQTVRILDIVDENRVLGQGGPDFVGRDLRLAWR